MHITDWSSFVDWSTKALLGWIALHGVHILSEMKKSIDSLNQKVARIIERTEWHSKEIDKLEHRLERLEKRV